MRLPFFWPYYLHLVRRGLLLWLAARSMVLAGSAAVGAPMLTLPPLALIMLLGVVMVLCSVDARLMREQIFHANLGTPMWAPVAVGMATALSMELVAAVVAGVVT